MRLMSPPCAADRRSAIVSGRPGDLERAAGDGHELLAVRQVVLAADVVGDLARRVAAPLGLPRRPGRAAARRSTPPPAAIATTAATAASPSASSAPSTNWKRGACGGSPVAASASAGAPAAARRLGQQVAAGLRPRRSPSTAGPGVPASGSRRAGTSDAGSTLGAFPAGSAGRSRGSGRSGSGGSPGRPPRSASPRMSGSLAHSLGQMRLVGDVDRRRPRSAASSTSTTSSPCSSLRSTSVSAIRRTCSRLWRTRQTAVR